jgi:hypothetical protein
MWNKKHNNKFLLLAILAAVCIASSLMAAEEDKKEESLAEEKVESDSKDNENKKVEKDLAPFVASEEVLADQAVAFPTDI